MIAEDTRRTRGEPMKVFSPRKFQDALDAHGMSVAQLTRAMVRAGSDIDQRVLYYWANGKTKAPTAGHLRMACEILKTAESELFEEAASA